ncbi:hypothetical protein JTE90_009356 [Oedothorax gibbosus]|uniref:Uncharacterized protein n=1 Tax=Oedothorax gibbosus TaxID=931172 RepID=A0AAV6VUX2_9ARAC|nr:hypothetical protein JTE90_009356 [Oedothorax gibbosus]
MRTQPVDDGQGYAKDVSEAQERGHLPAAKVESIGPQTSALGVGPAKGYRLLRVPRDHCLRRVPGTPLFPSIHCFPLPPGDSSVSEITKDDRPTHTTVLTEIHFFHPYIVSLKQHFCPPLFRKEFKLGR